MRRIVLVIGRARLEVSVEVQRSEHFDLAAITTSAGPRCNGAARRVRVLPTRIGKGWLSASLTTETRTGVFDSGAVIESVVPGTRSDRSQTDSGAENGKMTSAINQYAAARVESQPDDIFVLSAG
jgi:hypothetical protein